MSEGSASHSIALRRCEMSWAWAGDGANAWTRGASEKTLCDPRSRATKAFYPALSVCDLIFSGVFERRPASSSSSSSWTGRPACSRRWNTPTAGATARQFTASRPCPREGWGRHAADRLLPPLRCVELEENTIGIGLRDVIGVDNMMWDDVGLGLFAQRSDVSRSRKIPEEILAGVPDDE